MSALLSAANVHLYRRLMEVATQGVSDWLSAQRLYSGGDHQNVAKRLPVLQPGVGLEAALERACSYVLQHSLNVSHPDCVAHLHCPTLIAPQLAEVLISASNQSLDSWDQSPVATFLELRLLGWLRQIIGYASGDAGVFTSGGTQSNLMGLWLARDRILQRQWDIYAQEVGLPADACRLRVVCSEAAHFSVRKSLALLGLGHRAVLSVPTDDTGRLCPRMAEVIIRQSRARGEVPFALVATAGTTDLGAIDPIDSLATLANEQGLWLHVDAAWGGALLLSQKHRARLTGLAQADSVTLDFHKHWWQPISCSALLLRQAADLQWLVEHADYLNSATDAALGIPNLVERSLQTTRRFDALKLWMTLEAYGPEQLGHWVEACLARTAELADWLRDQPALELLHTPELSSLVFRPRNGADPQSLADILLSRGRANVGVTRLKGIPALKLTLLNPETELSSLKSLLSEVVNLAEALC